MESSNSLQQELSQILNGGQTTSRNNLMLELTSIKISSETEI